MFNVMTSSVSLKLVWIELLPFTGAVLESLFNKVAGPLQALRPATLLKRDSDTGPTIHIWWL